ncbi:hypothetical protein H4R20_006088, partial [Coemansia guatemalensis]
FLTKRLHNSTDCKRQSPESAAIRAAQASDIVQPSRRHITSADLIMMRAQMEEREMYINHIRMLRKATAANSKKLTELREQYAYCLGPETINFAAAEKSADAITDSASDTQTDKTSCTLNDTPSYAQARSTESNSVPIVKTIRISKDRLADPPLLARKNTANKNRGGKHGNGRRLPIYFPPAAAKANAGKPSS